MKRLKRVRAYLDLVIFVGALIPIIDQVRHRGAVPRLSRVTDPTAGSGSALPRLSVIVPACNEEAGVRAAVESMLRQDYPDLELVLVDDRSGDRTGEIMAQLAAEHPGRVQTITISQLPSGWLGKNHASWTGARRAGGEWLLFTDADIVFDPTCFRRAVVHAEVTGLDHLTLAPGVVARGYWLDAFVAFFIYAFQTVQRPYMANDPDSAVSVGVGAFNLIRRAAYEAIGTHRAVSLRPDDDLRLGARVKRLGLRQQLLNGADLTCVEWYPSLRAAVRGLEKNVFAGLNYRLVQVIGSTGALALFIIYPYVAVWRAGGWARRLLCGAIGAHLATFYLANREVGRPAARYLPAFPLAGLLFGYTVWRATVLTLIHGGIRWRGTFYPLEELKRQTGLE